ncbi:bifunctional metallophosphatase/5'-nucleotidase [Hespellia stercorisuis]|uniref:2',3'-cyclic-nucleotide 2'-phosphodiesterase/5'-or 3'-nucleotidase, 5'-nucleotidase family n=1 Tax=Hespellia stercorisuis DSM 15480 TaxID=1121950 RepID=A0A1M6JYW1_9FIRM|nr:5'-nucleotidase C-terminal domain-containing protein [Hespellia stercorisuis]SHJ51910.1 2',3'-cyclic-nucleotide 2'-phosphodiesterase/5'-or 3'-nucleotidase, 5'-nucleotidase family [Hespellia stercorisuis DSM 15480]
MKHFPKRILQTGLLLALLLSLFTFASTAGDAKTLDVLFTHDIHSHLDTFSTVVNGNSVRTGGLSRIQTRINEQREKNPDTLLVDGGDFSMGTLYQTVFEEQAAELRTLGAMGYDAVTIGNHEFDYRSEGLHNMMEAAVASGDPLPAFVLSNVDWDASTSAGAKSIKESFDDYGVKDYIVVEKGDVKLAIMGIFGKDALDCAPTCELIFQDPIEGARETVAEILKKEDVDMIVCLSHSGTGDSIPEPEDENLAESVPEIDLIISGHTHRKLEEPLVVGSTSIVSCECYGSCLGSLSMKEDSEGNWAVSRYDLIPITEDTDQDLAIQKKVDSFGSLVDSDYLEQFGYTKDQLLAENSYVFDDIQSLYDNHQDYTLGNLMADGFAYGAADLGANDTNPVDVAVIPSGVIRETYAQGKLTVSSVFNSFSLGIGPDRVVGYPLVSAYLTGKELRTAAEFDASCSDLMPSARLYTSGLSFTFNPNRIILNRVTDVHLTGADDERIELQDDKLYRVIFDYYSGQLIGSIKSQSAGLLSIVPKDADGNEVTDFDTCIVRDKNGNEVKAWQAIADYMQSFEDGEDGIPAIPEYYSTTHERKVVDDSTDLVSRFKNPNRYVALFAAVIIVLILIIVLLVLLIRKIVRRIRR